MQERTLTIQAYAMFKYPNRGLFGHCNTTKNENKNTSKKTTVID